MCDVVFAGVVSDVVVVVVVVVLVLVSVVDIVVVAAVVVDVLLLIGCESRSGSDRPCACLDAIGVGAAGVRRCGLCGCWFRRRIVQMLSISENVFRTAGLLSFDVN